MSEPEMPVETETRDDEAAGSGQPRGVFAGRLRAADQTIADGGPNAGSPRTLIAPPAHPPPSAFVPRGAAASRGAALLRDAAALRALIDRPETEMVWVCHPVSGARLFQLPAEVPEQWRAAADAEGGCGEAAAPELPPLTAETVLAELARIAFTDPLLPGRRAGARLPVTLRDKQTALFHLGRHFGLFTGHQPTRRPYANLSDDDLKARSDDVIRALGRLGVEVRIADDDPRPEGRAPLPP